MTDNQGFFLIDKPVGFTSFDVCAKLRKKLNIKKIGHTGTLDPFATGLLVIATGKCTKLIPFLEKAQKTYITKAWLGKISGTLDPESDIETDKNLPQITEADVEKILGEKFTGPIQQIPPKYSALKINGKKAYELARQGVQVEMKVRDTEVFEVELLNFEKKNGYYEAEIKLTTAAGFYVRSFARDLGKALGTLGMCGELRRTKVGDLLIEDAELIDCVTEAIDPKYILDTLPQASIPLGRVQDFIAGRAFPFHTGKNGEKYLILASGNSMGIGEIVHDKLQPRVVL